LSFVTAVACFMAFGMCVMQWHIVLLVVMFDVVAG